MKYIRLNENFIYIHSSAFANLAKLEEVVFVDNPSSEVSLALGSSSFAKCTSLTRITLSSQVTSIGERCFQGCTGLTTVDIGTGLTAIGTASFLDCTNLATLNIPEENSITRICHRAFDNCESLTGTYVFNNVTHIESCAFQYSATNEDTNLCMSFPAIVDLGCSGDGDSKVFMDSGVCELYFGNTLSAMAFNTFTRATRLWRIEMAGVTEGFVLRGYTFDGCTALKAFSIPEGITALPSRMFNGCTNLTAVYLPSGLTAINSGSNSFATFKDCKNLYFVDKPFTYTSVNDIPAEPSVYYFPTSLSVVTEEAFDGSRVNDTIVFPETLTSLTQGYTFEGTTSANGTPNIVFLGNMESVTITSWSANKIYFCNEADVDLTTAGATNDARIVFCNAEGNTTHLKEKTLATEATCTMPKMVADYCFCGAIVGTPQTEGDALGHNLGEAYYIFTTLTEKGKTCKDCVRCGEFTEETEHENAILTDIGYSVMTFETGNGTASFDNGYTIDNELLAIYEATKGTTVTFGVAFNAYDGFDFDGTLDSFKVKSDIVASSDADFGAFAYKVIYSDASRFDALIVIGVYARENEALTFVNADNGVFAPVSYNSVLNSVQ